MPDPLADLADRLAAATGSDPGLDKALEQVLLAGDGASAPDYTASVDRCIDLVHRAKPGWAWHVGWDASGVLPYARLHQGSHHAEAAGPTVPLALLRALVAAQRLDREGG